MGMGEHKSYEVYVEDVPVLIGPDTQFWELRDVYKEPLEGIPVYETMAGEQYLFDDEDYILDKVDPPFAGVFRFVKPSEVDVDE